MGSCSSVDEMSGQTRTSTGKSFSKNELAEWVNNNIEDSSDSFDEQRTVGKRNSIHGRTLNEHIRNINNSMDSFNNKLRNPVAQTQYGDHKYFVPVAVVPTESVPVKNDKNKTSSSTSYYSSSSETESEFKSSDFSSY